jgi:hypothetical protein
MFKPPITPNFIPGIRNESLKVVVTDFCYERQFVESGKSGDFTVYLGSKEDLIEIIQTMNPLLKKEVETISFISEDILNGFEPALVKVTPKTNLIAKPFTRRVGEAPYIKIVSPDKPEPLKKVTLVLYSAEALAKDDIFIPEGAYGVVSINGEIDLEEKEPQPFISLARNYLGEYGGTKREVSSEEFAKSIMYWQKYVFHLRQ